MKINENLEKEHEKLKTLFDSQQTKLRDMTKVLTALGEKNVSLEQKCESFATKEQVERHTREIIAVKDALTNQEGTIARLERSPGRGGDVSSKSNY